MALQLAVLLSNSKQGNKTEFVWTMQNKKIFKAQQKKKIHTLQITDIKSFLPSSAAERTSSPSCYALSVNILHLAWLPKVLICMCTDCARPHLWTPACLFFFFFLIIFSSCTNKTMKQRFHSNDTVQCLRRGNFSFQLPSSNLFPAHPREVIHHSRHPSPSWHQADGFIARISPASNTKDERLTRCGEIRCRRQIPGCGICTGWQTSREVRVWWMLISSTAELSFVIIVNGFL